MKTKNVRNLINRLSPYCARAFEEGASFASTRSHYEVTIEHVLIKLLEEGGADIERILAEFNINIDALWQEILEELSGLRSHNTGKPTFSPLLFKWLEKSWVAASLYYETDEIRSTMLLDALVELAPVLPGRAFASLDNVSLDKLRSEYKKITEGSTESQYNIQPNADGNAENSAIPRGMKSDGQDSALARFTEDVTLKAKNGQIDPVLGRDEEVRMMIDILSRRRKNNPILVGDPGVGKTALVEGLAIRITQNKVPDELKEVHIHTLDLGLLQAGAGVKGEFEKRLKQVIDEVKNSTVPLIVFIDEAHTLIGAGGEAGMSDAANLLKPALARGELRTIAATTWSEYKKYFERDAALERRFQLVKVDEPSEKNAIVMLNGLKQHYQTHHNIMITDDAVEAAVKLSSRYISGRQLPDKAIDLLDTAAARIRMGHAAKPFQIESIENHINYINNRIEHLEAEKKAGLYINEKLLTNLLVEREESEQTLESLQRQWQQEIELVDKIKRGRNSLLTKGKKKPSKDSIIELKNNSRQWRDKLLQIQADSPMVQAEVNAASIAEVISDWTGIPLGNMVKDDITALMRLEEKINTRVVGQEHAISIIASSIRSARAGLRNPDAPLGVFLLTGPSGVGKTETARAIAEELLGSEHFLITINMSEYQEAHSVSQLKGSPPGYVGYGEGGVLSEAVRQRPYSVVLLDEVEKAHADVLNLFYQIFDRGFMRDGEGREIDFKNTIIIMTSNLGGEEILEMMSPPVEAREEASGGGSDREEEWQQPTVAEIKDAIKPVLMECFAPALLGRMQVIPYLPLNEEALQTITALKLESVAKRLQETHAMDMHCQPEVLQHLAGKCALPETGARYLHTLIDQQLLPEIARSLLGYMLDDDMPDIMRLELDEEKQLACVFSDRLDDVPFDKNMMSGKTETQNEELFVS